MKYSKNKNSGHVEMHPKMYLYRRIVQAKLFIDDQYSNRIALDHISDHACLSKYHFLRLFKKAYGTSPHQYLTKVRIASAKDLLKEGRPVAEVCIQVGFESTPSFIHLFKKNTGVSPDIFRKRFISEITKRANSPLSFVPNCFATNYGQDK